MTHCVWDSCQDQSPGLGAMWSGAQMGTISRFFHRNSNLMENWLSVILLYSKYHIAMKVCKCHNSTAVIPGPKFHSDHFTTTWMSQLMRESSTGPEEIIPHMAQKWFPQNSRSKFSFLRMPMAFMMWQGGAPLFCYEVHAVDALIWQEQLLL